MLTASENATAELEARDSQFRQNNGDFIVRIQILDGSNREVVVYQTTFTDVYSAHSAALAAYDKLRDEWKDGREAVFSHEVS